MERYILITGVGGPAGRSAATYFREKGLRIIGTDVREVDTPVDEFAIVPLAIEPGFPSALLEIIKKKRPILFLPTVTEELVIVAGLKKEIEDAGSQVFISPPGAVEIANDKLKTARFMEENGVPVPRTFVSSSPRELLIRELGLPLLAKPCFGRGGRGVSLHRTAQDVYKETREGIIFQEFIPGEEFDVNLFIDKGGLVRAAVALRKTALKEGLVGNALGVERAVRDDAVEICKKAAGLLSMEGPLDFDVRLREDGAPALLEINARLGGNSLSAREVLDCFMGSVTQKK